MHIAAADFQGEQHVDPFECHGAIHMEEVHGQHGRSLRAQELPPCRVGVPGWCWRYLSLFEDSADRRSADAVAKFD
jgi:hypothetical protein